MSNGADTSNNNPSEKEKADALYENRAPKKIIRIITVTAYMFSVSFVGIVLSAYYIFLWHPPNPRMMHAQAMNAHAGAQVDFLVGSSPTPDRLSQLNKLPDPDPTIDLFHAQLGNERTKTRREVMKNVNAVLRANFEKAKSSEALLQYTDHHIINSTMPSVHISKETSAFNNGTMSVIPEVEDILKMTNESRKTSASTVPSSPTKKTKNTGKKQHQTPFALKHLEVPIKQDESRRRSTRFTPSSTTKLLPTPSDAKDVSMDRIKYSPETTMKYSKEAYATNPPMTIKNLFQILTTPSSRRNSEKPSYTDLPELLTISSDRFEPERAVNSDNYPDSTIEPEDDLLED